MVNELSTLSIKRREDPTVVMVYAVVGDDGVARAAAGDADKWSSGILRIKRGLRARPGVRRACVEDADYLHVELLGQLLICGAQVRLRVRVLHDGAFEGYHLLPARPDEPPFACA